MSSDWVWFQSCGTNTLVHRRVKNSLSAFSFANNLIFFLLLRLGEFVHASIFRSLKQKIKKNTNKVQLLHSCLQSPPHPPSPLWMSQKKGKIQNQETNKTNIAPCHYKLILFLFYSLTHKPSRPFRGFVTTSLKNKQNKQTNLHCTCMKSGRPLRRRRIASHKLQRQ